MKHRIALFGETEKGQFHTPFFLRSLPELAEKFGNPPEESVGLFFAIQALLYERELVFFRVKEEGFSIKDYFVGFKFLENKEAVQKINALCLPGVGDNEIIEAAHSICEIHKSFLIITEKDLYDYLSFFTKR